MSSSDLIENEDSLGNLSEDALLRDLDLPTVIYIKTLKAENENLKQQMNVILSHNAALWEEKILLEGRVSDFNKKNEEMMKEVEMWKESATSLEHKNYVMNQLMDDLATACNSLYDNLQAVVYERQKYSKFFPHQTQQQHPHHHLHEGNEPHEIHEVVPERSMFYRRKSRMFGDEKRERRRDMFAAPQIPDLKHVKGTDFKHVAQKLQVCVDITTTLHRVSRITQ